MPRQRERASHSQPRLISGNLLIYGDNLRVMRESPFFRDDSVDLVYLDPPFKHDEKYNVLFRARTGTPSQAQVRAFDDAWNWDEAAKAAYHDVLENSPLQVRRTIDALRDILGPNDMFAYLCMMAPRLGELRRVLRETGSIYLHCDPAASHYLKVLMDAVFNPTNFRSEVIWKRTSAHSSAKRFGPVHDVLLFYSKTSKYTWNPVYQPLPQETLDQWYNNVEPGTGRRFNRADLTASGIRKGPSGEPWRGIDPSRKGRHWAIPGFVKSIVKGLETQDALEALDAAGRIFWPKKQDGMPMVKRYIEESRGIPAQDVISDIYMNNVSSQRLGYPTQKPIALLERIIRASSNRGDVVFDPFCGCGTTIEAAQNQGRKWIGIDIAYDAIRIIRGRLSEKNLVEKSDYEVWGEPESVEDALRLAEEDKYQFQWWAVRRLGGREITYKKGPDERVDGRVVLRAERLGDRLPEAVISVKAGRTSGPRHVSELRGVVERERAEVGVLVTRGKPTPAMEREAAKAGEYTDGSDWYPRIQLLTAADIIAGSRVQYPAVLPEDVKQSAPRGKPRKGTSKQDRTPTAPSTRKGTGGAKQR